MSDALVRNTTDHADDSTTSASPATQRLLQRIALENLYGPPLPFMCENASQPWHRDRSDDRWCVCCRLAQIDPDDVDGWRTWDWERRFAAQTGER